LVETADAARFLARVLLLAHWTDAGMLETSALRGAHEEILAAASRQMETAQTVRRNRTHPFTRLRDLTTFLASGSDGHKIQELLFNVAQDSKALNKFILFAFRKIMSKNKQWGGRNKAIRMIAELVTGAINYRDLEKTWGDLDFADDLLKRATYVVNTRLKRLLPGRKGTWRHKQPK
jgi:hypothetical protein